MFLSLFQNTGNCHELFHVLLEVKLIISSGDGKKVMIDVESKTGPEILEIVSKAAGATEM